MTNIQIITATRSATRANGADFDSGYLGAVAKAGTYGLFSRAETNKTGGWYLYNGPGYPAGITGGGMLNSDPSSGGNFDNNAGFEIHFEGTGIALYGLSNTPYGFAAGKLDGVAIPGGIPYNQGSGSIIAVYQVQNLAPGRHVLLHYADPTNTQASIPQYYTIS